LPSLNYLLNQILFKNFLKKNFFFFLIRIKNKIDYTTEPKELSIKIYNDKVEITPPYTQSCIQSTNYGSKNLALYHIKKWWNEKK